ncbi:nitrogenase-stabilizing/protective protein NifW [Rhodovulum sulfidophilum]|uniref:nitrogenase-stabilizing/protective protein NifW n=1 Tax=Rhodovulum sulfidophilum TaxID=35806 RepID=UPI001924A67C|nr:nitrogenase-stabilizing/protective protein NifW [Rhodovulum sulfidophilum]MBL3564486.1 nitrogenase-stabilizing/protective protein NifW [Rhodovulum sulfidophilum]
MTRPAPRPSMLDQLYALSSAEDLFAFLDLPFDQAVLNRARLHVMKRMGQYLDETDLSQLDDDGVRAAAREALQKAHADFEDSTPSAQKALKIYTQPRGNVVPMEGLRLSVK